MADISKIKALDNVTYNLKDDRIFIAEYNVTSYSDINAAYTAGKTIILKVNSSRYAFIQYVQNNEFSFAALTSVTGAARWSVSSQNVWSSGSVGLSTTNTTYTLSISGNRITLTPSSGAASYVDLPVYDGSVT